MIHTVAETGKALDHVAPSDVNRIDHSARKPQRPVGAQAVCNCESVEHGADVFCLQPSPASAQVHGSTSWRQRSGPEDEALGNPGIPGMEPEWTSRRNKTISHRTRRQAVKSYER